MHLRLQVYGERGTAETSNFNPPATGATMTVPEFVEQACRTSSSDYETSFGPGATEALLPFLPARLRRTYNEIWAFHDSLVCHSAMGYGFYAARDRNYYAELRPPVIAYRGEVIKDWQLRRFQDGEELPRGEDFTLILGVWLVVSNDPDLSRRLLPFCRHTDKRWSPYGSWFAPCNTLSAFWQIRGIIDRYMADCLLPRDAANCPDPNALIRHIGQAIAGLENNADAWL